MIRLERRQLGNVERTELIATSIRKFREYMERLALGEVSAETAEFLLEALTDAAADRLTVVQHEIWPDGFELIMNTPIDDLPLLRSSQVYFRDHGVVYLGETALVHLQAANRRTLHRFLDGMGVRPEWLSLTGWEPPYARDMIIQTWWQRPITDVFPVEPRAITRIRTRAAGRLITTLGELFAETNRWPGELEELQELLQQLASPCHAAMYAPPALLSRAS